MRASLHVAIALPLVGLFVGACGGSAFEGGAGSAGSGAASGRVGVAGGSNLGGAGPSGGAGSGGSVAGGGALAGSGGNIAVDIRACVSNTDCALAAAGCCSCGIASLSDITGINSKYTSQFLARCQTQDLACGPCPAGPAIPADPNAAKLYFVPTCQAGECTAVDLRTTDITACSITADCSLRVGTACCPSCGDLPVALNTENEPQLSQLVCGLEASACSGCSLDTYSSYSAACVEGRCNVELSPCTSAHPCPD